MVNDIMDQIVENRRREVKQREDLYPIAFLEQSVYFETESVSLREYLQRDDLVGIIAEMKRRSPSKGVLHEYFSAEALSIGYMQAGASALSVLTEGNFFGGSNQDLSSARKYNYCPILRKDFIFSDYQVVEAKSIGADVILLIAAILTPQEISSLSRLAHNLGMEVLLEVHSQSEIERAPLDEVDLVGVNNRDLKTFEVSVERSFELASLLPDSVTRISESGIDDPKLVLQLKAAGYEGFLIGERFMRETQPEVACRKFIESIKRELEN